MLTVYWDRTSAPLRAVERTHLDIDNQIEFRAAYEGISPARVRSQYRREHLLKRVTGKVRRTFMLSYPKAH